MPDALDHAFRVGHNGGPPLEPEPGRSWRRFCWKRACARAWKSPPPEVVRRRLKRAQELGMSYRQYTLVILDRGVHL